MDSSCSSILCIVSVSSRLRETGANTLTPQHVSPPAHIRAGNGRAVDLSTSCIGHEGTPGHNNPNNINIFSAWFIDVWSLAAEASVCSVCLRKPTERVRERGS